MISESLSFRLTPYLNEQLKIITDKVGINKSELVRISVLYFVMNFDKQVERDLENLKKGILGR